MNALGLRKAAIALASLHPDDQTWLLERLRPSWRHDLRRLIDQASSLQLSESDVIRDAIHVCENEESLQTPSPDLLLAGMRGLSPEWCARVLVACAPDHMEVFAANSTPARAGAVRAELLMLQGLPPKLAETLTRVVRARGESSVLPQGEGAH